MKRRTAGLAALALMALAAAAAAADTQDNPYLPVDGADFRSALSPSGTGAGTGTGTGTGTVHVAGFLLQRHPVTNAEFLAFVARHPEWRRGAAAPLLADADYLGHWQAPDALGPAAPPRQPATRVSWFAAEAYCEAQGARLPAWHEWELAAAASRTVRDARADPAWRQQILDWYARPAGQPLPAVESSAPDVYGLYDLHGLVWEWVLDANSLMGSDEAQKFCGGGALSVSQKENFAVLMRVAMLSSLRARDTGHALGFRCARDLAEPPQ
ncbi:MAG: formylglycine-generating enzyme family protein [Nevskia sp.]|nr:formylglycine-generating enzyme family protein [Nevskia sp.]